MPVPIGGTNDAVNVGLGNETVSGIANSGTDPTAGRRKTQGPGDQARPPYYQPPTTSAGRDGVNSLRIRVLPNESVYEAIAGQFVHSVPLDLKCQ